MATSNGGVPPGFRFHPTDEELLHYYLKKKVAFQKFDMEVIREVDLNKMEPWDLQERCRIGSTPQNEWYFFSHKDRKYPTGSRTNRATSAGFWKATGRDKCIRNSYRKIGMRKTLVFYGGRAPHGQKTDWIMHEYRLEDGDDPQPNSSSEDGWVVCRVFKKKNLFKLGSNNDQGGTTSANSSDHPQQLNALNTNNNNQYLMSQHRFQLKHHDLALHYPPPNIETNPLQYSLFHSQTQLMPPHNNHKPLGLYEYVSLQTETPPVMVKQLMTGVRDCESGSESQMRYQACEAGLEVGSGTTCEPAAQQMVGAGAGAAGTGRDEGLNEWAMLDRIVSSHHLGNDDSSSSKGVRYEDGNGGAAHSINNLSLRGEMDFWGYEK